jgi:hypothetical protein
MPTRKASTKPVLTVPPESAHIARALGALKGCSPSQAAKEAFEEHMPAILAESKNEKPLSAVACAFMNAAIELAGVIGERNDEWARGYLVNMTGHLLSMKELVCRPVK